MAGDYRLRRLCYNLSLKFILLLYCIGGGLSFGLPCRHESGVGVAFGWCHRLCVVYCCAGFGV
jgi:hypothetical protein